MNSKCNNPLMNTIGKDIDKQILMEMLTHFVYGLEDKLNLDLSIDEKSSYVSIDKLPIQQLQKRINRIEDKVEELIKDKKKVNTKIYLNQSSKLIDELREQNEKVSKETDKKFNSILKELITELKEKINL